MGVQIIEIPQGSGLYFTKYDDGYIEPLNLSGRSLLSNRDLGFTAGDSMPIEVNRSFVGANTGRPVAITVTPNGGTITYDDWAQSNPADAILTERNKQLARERLRVSNLIDNETSQFNEAAITALLASLGGVGGRTLLTAGAVSRELPALLASLGLTGAAGYGAYQLGKSMFYPGDAIYLADTAPATAAPNDPTSTAGGAAPTTPPPTGTPAPAGSTTAAPPTGTPAPAPDNKPEDKKPEKPKGRLRRLLDAWKKPTEETAELHASPVKKHFSFKPWKSDYPLTTLGVDGLIFNNIVWPVGEAIHDVNTGQKGGYKTFLDRTWGHDIGDVLDSLFYDLYKKNNTNDTNDNKEEVDTVKAEQNDNYYSPGPTTTVDSLRTGDIQTADELFSL